MDTDGLKDAQTLAGGKCEHRRRRRFRGPERSNSAAAAVHGNLRKRGTQLELVSFDIDKHTELVQMIQSELKAEEAMLSPLAKESKTRRDPWQSTEHKQGIKIGRS
eukprot:COSAG02_NODE_1777_length_10954_cov_11.819714_4_plen_106_part_00